MRVKETGHNSLNSIYISWKNTRDRYSPKMDKSEFSFHYFENPLGIRKSFLVEKEKKNLGSVMLESYENLHHLHDWLGYRESSVFEELMNTFQSLDET